MSAIRSPVGVRRMLLCAVSGGAGVLLLLAAALRTGAAEFFVAANGNDSNAGTIDAPFGTLEAARAAISNLKRSGGLSAGRANVWIRGGDYLRSDTFQLTSGDSGTSASVIVYSAWSNEVVNVIGGRLLTNFGQITRTDVLQRLSTSARTNVLECNLAACGITNFGQLRERGYGIDFVPAHLELFLDGRPMTLARYPNLTQWTQIAGVPSGGRTGPTTNGFYWGDTRFSSWSPTNEIWAGGYWGHAYTFFTERITSINATNNLVLFSSPNKVWDGFATGQPFFFMNILEELDSPGEYYVDRFAGQLYFWPPAPLQTNEIIASQLEVPLVSLYQCSNVCFMNVNFKASRGAAVQITGGATNSLIGCEFRGIGACGVYVNYGSGHLIDSCSFVDVGDDGVIIRHAGDRQTLTPSGIVVRNCVFNAMGRWSKVYHPAVSLDGVGCRVSHNVISNHSHSAIIPKGNDHVIEFNDISRVCLETPKESGVIYFGHDYAARGNGVRYNYMHDVGRDGQDQAGVYLDDCASGVMVASNIFNGVSEAVKLGGGRDNIIDNNVFVNCPNMALWIDGRGLDPSFSNMVYGVMMTQFYSVPIAFYSARYAGIAAIDGYYQQGNYNGIPPENNIVSRNLCVNCVWSNVSWFATASMVGWSNNYVGTDPGFIDPANGNFNVRSNLDVLSLGFQDIPVDRIGVYPPASRPTPPSYIRAH